MDGVVATAAAELEDLAHRLRGIRQQPGEVGRLLAILLWWRDQRPPQGEISVEPVLAPLVLHWKDPKLWLWLASVGR